MKKTLSVLISVFIIFSLCGCSAKEAISSDKQEYIVSSLGFDNHIAGVKMILESVVVNSDDLSAEKQNKLIIGTGKTPDEAFAEIYEQITQPLMLSHTAVVIIGEGIGAEMMDSILDFCYRKDEINLSAMFVCTESSEKLLNCNAISSVAVGYDIMSMVEVLSEERGVVIENLFYQIESARDKPSKTFYMPYLNVKEKDFSFDECTVFKNDNIVETLKFEQVYAMGFITDNVTKGSFRLDGKNISIKASKTTYDFYLKENLKINLNIRIKTQEDSSLIKSSIEELFQLWQIRGIDIFGMDNIIYRQSPEVWSKIKNNYPDFFKKAELQVNINE